jgi:hypothetical protein
MHVLYTIIYEYNQLYDKFMKTINYIDNNTLIILMYNDGNSCKQSIILIIHRLYSCTMIMSSK